jgi:hypothetical protein
MSVAFPRIYRSFHEFERDELRKLDSLHTTVDDMLDEAFAEEVEDDDPRPRARRGGRRPAAIWD